MPLRVRLTLAGCLALAACGPKASDVNVQASYGKNLSELGIIPLYPPREDVFVGDIQLYVQNPCDTGVTSNQPQAILMGGIPLADVQAAMEKYYSERAQLPSTSKPPSTSTTSAPAKGAPAAAQSKVTLSTPGSATISVGASAAAPGPTAGAGPNAVPAQPVADAKNPMFPAAKPSPVTRLRMAAFPDFSYSDFTSGGIGATIPVQGAKISAGGSKQKSRQGDVSVSQVEEAMLPMPMMLRLVNDYLHGPHKAEVLNRGTVAFLKTLYEQQMISSLGCTAPAQHSSKPAYVVFLTRVFYARTFDYQFSQSDAAAASLRVALAAATAAQTAPAGTSAPAASANAAQAAADAAANSVKSLTSSTTPGGAASLEIGSQGGLSLKQTFDRPLAFGVGQPIVFDADETLAKIEAN